MGRLLIFLGVILIIVAIVLMIGVFSVADIPFVEDMMIDLYCEPDETTISSASRLSFSGTQNSSTVWFCETDDGDQREITNYIGLTGAGAFLVPFLIGLSMIMFGAWSVQRNLRNKLMNSFGGDNIHAYSMQGANDFDLSNSNISPEQQAQMEQVLQTVSSVFGKPASSSTLTERLQQLEEARRQGLISSAEFERTRQAILDSMDDNI